MISLDRNTPTAAVTRHVPIDLADPRSIDSALTSLDGRYDGLISVAGIPGTAPASLVLAVNTLAVRHLCEAFPERLNERGSITIVSSTAGLGWPSRLDPIRDLLATETFEDGVDWFNDHPQEGNAYNFSKEATTFYAMSMSIALALRGFRINAVLPGPVETPILADFEKSMGKDTLDGVKSLLGRHAQPDEIASAVLFLASDAARWVNGQTLSVDGGLSGAVLSGAIPQPAI
ncbi:3-alpha-hydroxysteroid dehydrogenase/carbonyl reductase [Mycobacteroides salmoniphilum]|uniref:3-alpha-hydroxysteroid dehydrogenase/carbonyl reductase n=1 Tax=Mycobacteroides salmoniphilum TaxID=404941 RepID=A0A4V3HZB2_9MYCO|nr:3-alpha-hydroxysteroid dehydrogenase/carbonyl reductase [Mycobacteroides salmoniphilum]TEA07818.1 3-alpha-hydroxysteroid dehydrogenase/carbonyl reductase [Mycobacteroides salmoniphilum]